MEKQQHADPLENLLRAARKDEPDALDDARAHALVTSAVRAAKTRRSTRVVVTAGAMLTLAAAAALVVMSRDVPEEARTTGPEVATHALPHGTRAGDRLHGTEDAAFAVATDESSTRRIVLTRGTVLCDVRPLAGDASFEVVVDDVHVRVRGTVFSVERAPLTVRVYEGVVEVEDRGALVRVTAGERWSREGGAGPLDTHVLDPIAREAAATRVRAQADVVAPPAAAEPTPAVVAEAPAARTALTPDAPEEREAPARPMPSRLVTPSATEAEGLLRHGDAASALALAEAERARGDRSPRWMLVRADALRALGRAAEAADAYDDAARVDARHRAEAGYAAASIRFRTLHDSDGALRSLDASGAISSSLAERALTLRVKLLRAEGRELEARADAERYLADFPEGTSAGFMQGVLGRTP